jgi:PEP-CTERM motif
MRKYLWIIIAALIVGVVAPNANADTTYNVVTGFSHTSNPNGVWTYELSGAPYTDSQGFANVSGLGLPGWWNSKPEPDSMAILQNVTGSTFIFSTDQDPTGTLLLDPESGNLSVLFTAPSAGKYTITGNFLGIDTSENSHPVEILDNGTIVWSETISSFKQDDSFNLNETLSAGDTISFYVGTGSTGCSYCDLGTGLNDTVTESSPTATPEPSTLALTLAGIGALFTVMATRKGQGLQVAV